LVVDRGRSRSTWLPELLWPERAREAAANNFHQALYVARRALEVAGGEASAVLPLRDDMLVLYPGGRVEVDVDVFEAAVARARGTGELSDYRAALALYGGELLPEDRYERWAVGRREASSEAHLGLLLELSARLAEDGDAPAAIEVLERAVVIDPLHEEVHRALMRLFAAGGRRQHALEQYHQLRGALSRDLEGPPRVNARNPTVCIGRRPYWGSDHRPTCVQMAEAAAPALLGCPFARPAPDPRSGWGQDGLG
jgi:DNA-binding SARP family transcriptional activator